MRPRLGPILARYHRPVLSHTDASQSGVAAAAFGAGLPVVAMPVGGLIEQVVDGVTGLLASRADAPALADATKRLLLDPTLYRAVCTNIARTREQRSMATFVKDCVSHALHAGSARVPSIMRQLSNTSENRAWMMRCRPADRPGAAQLGFVRHFQEALIVALADTHHFAVRNCNGETADSPKRHLPGRIVEEEFGCAVFFSPLRSPELLYDCLSVRADLDPAAEYKALACGMYICGPLWHPERAASSARPTAAR